MSPAPTASTDFRALMTPRTDPTAVPSVRDVLYSAGIVMQRRLLRAEAGGPIPADRPGFAGIGIYVPVELEEADIIRFPHLAIYEDGGFMRASRVDATVEWLVRVTYRIMTESVNVTYAKANRANGIYELQQALVEVILSERRLRTEATAPFPAGLPSGVQPIGSTPNVVGTVDGVEPALTIGKVGVVAMNQGAAVSCDVSATYVVRLVDRFPSPYSPETPWEAPASHTIVRN